MSNDNLPQKNHNDDVDLLVLFNYFGDKFNQLFGFIGKILKAIYSFIIYTSKAVIDNFKFIAGILVVAGVLGFAAQKLSKPVYESNMLVKTFFDAKYQLNTNLNYYNALLDEENMAELERIFEIGQDQLATIKSFELNSGPENENEIIRHYDLFLKTIDSTRASEITYEEYVENRDIFSGNFFEINIESTQIDIFKNLETGIYKSFDNLYSIDKKKKRDSLIEIRKETLMNSLVVIDSLKQVYIQVLEEESKTADASINLGSGFPLQQEKSSTNEYQLLNKEIEIRNTLAKLDEEKVEEDAFFEVISGFQEVGNVVDDPFRKYMLVFPAAAMILLFLYYLLGMFTKYVRSYDG